MKFAAIDPYAAIGPANVMCRMFGVLDWSIDLITVGRGRIDLAAIDPSRVRGDQAFTFIGTGAFTTTPHSTFELLRYEAAADGYLLVQGGSNRDGVADFSFLLYATSLNERDFMWQGAPDGDEDPRSPRAPRCADHRSPGPGPSSVRSGPVRGVSRSLRYMPDRPSCVAMFWYE